MQRMFDNAEKQKNLYRRQKDMERPLTREELIKKIETKENVSNVDTSEIKDMSHLFIYDMYEAIYRGKDFNQPLNDWDVSKVENMVCMFYGATSFNHPLNEWDVSNVDNMLGMFCGATSFNQPLNEWDVSNVVYMESMFCGATSFNQPLNDWDVSNVKTMREMFYRAKNFNQSLNEWDVSRVTDMTSMFTNAKNYTYSFKTWKLKPACGTNDFLKGCNLWSLFNTVEDLPMQDNERIETEDKKIWKLL